MTTHNITINGSTVFKVIDHAPQKTIEVFKNTRIDEFTCEKSMCFKQKYETAFFGDTILLHVGRNNYIFICEKILKISIPKDDVILELRPSSVAIGKINTYFLMENKFCDASEVYEPLERKFIISSEDSFDDE
jgi:hypothetical protein